MDVAETGWTRSVSGDFVPGLLDLAPKLSEGGRIGNCALLDSIDARRRSVFAIAMTKYPAH